MNKLQRIAFICALLPLIVGTSIFVAFVVSENPDLAIFGVFTIIFGVLLFIVGIVALFIAGKQAKIAGKDIKRNNFYILCLLFANFPISVFMVFYSVDIMTAYRLTIVNDFDKPIREIVIIESSHKQHKIENISAHSNRRYLLHFKSEGAVKYRINSEGIKQDEFILEGYGSSPQGGENTITITADGTSKTIQKLGIIDKSCCFFLAIFAHTSMDSDFFFEM